MDRKLLGRYIVTDPQICHGQPTFRGTRIMVKQVLEQVASGMAWEAIVNECPIVAGSTDIDLNFSPSTNLLPIRRLGLAIG